MPRKKKEETDELEMDIDRIHFDEIEAEESVTTYKGQVRFKSVNHSERAEGFGRISDGETAKYLNVALEYFDNRCALSGEPFVRFNEKAGGRLSNLSAEHVVALCIGGHDIVPNLTPTVLQYNIKKNGYYLLDYWNKQTDITGKPIYSPYRLLKLVNYMMKSMQARGKSIEEYRTQIMTSNEIDILLERIKEEDIQEQDNSKRKLLSDTITATTIDEDNKKILTVIPDINGSMPTQREQQEQLEARHYDESTMIDIFLTDAVGELSKVEEISNSEITLPNGTKTTIRNKLQQMLQDSIGEIPFEVEVRNRILTVLEENNIGNKYSVANDLLQNTDILEQAREKNNVEQIITSQISRVVLEGLTEEQRGKIISIVPQVLYNEEERETTLRLLKQYTNKHIDNPEKINIELLRKPYFVNIIKIQQWMQNNDTRMPPRGQNSSKTVPEEEAKLGGALAEIKRKLIKRYTELKTEEERIKYKEKHPELEEVMAIVEKIDRNNIPIYLQNAQTIQKWMQDNNTTNPPSQSSKQQEEKRLGTALSNIRRFIKSYTELQTEEERKQYKIAHPELEEVMTIVEKIDRNNIPIYLQNARTIQKWMQYNNTSKPPRQKSEDLEEVKLGKLLNTIKQELIKRYTELKTEEEREAYRHKHPELEEVMAIVEEIDRNNIPIKEEQAYYINIKAIQQWMYDNNTSKPPSSKSRETEEAKLGTALGRIKNKLIKPYMELQTEEERKQYKIDHPELEEVMAIVEEIDRNNIPINLQNALAIQRWMEKNNTSEPPRTQNKKKTVPEEEANLGALLNTIRNKLIKQYMELQTEEERKKYKNTHPGLEEVMAIVEEIDRNNVPIHLVNAREIKKWMYDNNKSKPPSQNSKEQEEKRLGTALSRIRNRLIKSYTELQTEEEREAYRHKHPELEEVMAIVEEMDRNNPNRSKGQIGVLEEEKQCKIKTIKGARELEEKIDGEIAKVKQRQNDEMII